MIDAFKAGLRLPDDEAKIREIWIKNSPFRELLERETRPKWNHFLLKLVRRAPERPEPTRQLTQPVPAWGSDEGLGHFWKLGPWRVNPTFAALIALLGALTIGIVASRPRSAVTLLEATPAATAGAPTDPSASALPPRFNAEWNSKRILTLHLPDGPIELSFPREPAKALVLSATNGAVSGVLELGANGVPQSGAFRHPRYGSFNRDFKAR